MLGPKFLAFLDSYSVFILCIIEILSSSSIKLVKPILYLNFSLQSIIRDLGKSLFYFKGVICDMERLILVHLVCDHKFYVEITKTYFFQNLG